MTVPRLNRPHKIHTQASPSRSVYGNISILATWPKKKHSTHGFLRQSLRHFARLQLQPASSTNVPHRCANVRHLEESNVLTTRQDKQDMTNYREAVAMFVAEFGRTFVLHDNINTLVACHLQSSWPRLHKKQTEQYWRWSMLSKNNTSSLFFCCAFYSEAQSAGTHKHWPKCCVYLDNSWLRMRISRDLAQQIVELPPSMCRRKHLANEWTTAGEVNKTEQI